MILGWHKWPLTPGGFMKKLLVFLAGILLIPCVYADSSKTICTVIAGVLKYSGDAYFVSGEWRNIINPSLQIPFNEQSNTPIYVAAKSGYYFQIDTMKEMNYGVTYTYRFKNCNNLDAILANRSSVIISAGVLDPTDPSPQSYCHLD
jgi:hypothetical protein